MYTNKKGVSNSLIAVLIVVALMVVIVGTIIIVDGTQKVNQKTPITTVERSTGFLQMNIAGPTTRQAGATGLLTLSME